MNLVINRYCCLLISIFLFNYVCFAQGKIGDKCLVTERDNIKGTCKLLEDCPRAVKQQEQNNKTLQYCGNNNGNSPILVCCPNVGEISNQQCSKYGQAVYEITFAPSFSLRREKVNTSTCANDGSGFIIGGEPAKEKEFPHMALLRYEVKDKKQWLCGGSLISDQWVLTAAHCIKSRQQLVPKWVRLGEMDITTENAYRKDISIKLTIVHPLYLIRAKYHDIGLIQLDEVVKFNGHIRPACLYTLTNINPDMKYIAAGWGKQDDGISSNNLLKVTLDQFSNEECNDEFEQYKKTKSLMEGIRDDIQLCAGGKNTNKTKDTCQGDSGGPLQTFNKEVYCMYDIVGVTSFGKNCKTSSPGVYARVSHYIEWIENIVWF